MTRTRRLRIRKPWKRNIEKKHPAVVNKALWCTLYLLARFLKYRYNLWFLSISSVQDPLKDSHLKWHPSPMVKRNFLGNLRSSPILLIVFTQLLYPIRTPVWLHCLRKLQAIAAKPEFHLTNYINCSQSVPSSQYIMPSGGWTNFDVYLICYAWIYRYYCIFVLKLCRNISWKHWYSCFNWRDILFN